MEKFKFLAKNKISQLPKSPGVYAFRKDEKFLYIGKAANLKERIKQHRKLLGLAEQLAYIEGGSGVEALLLEAKLIKKYQPKYNISWKDDKNYFYVGITKEPFPRIFVTHQPKLKIENCKLKIDYVGPFVDGKKLKQTLKELRKIHPYRTCKTLPRKPCLWHYLSQCPAPCLFKSRRIEAYDVSNIQGQQAAGSMVTFINGKPDKNFYRRFKIKYTNGARSAKASRNANAHMRIRKPNDIGMLKEVLSRRFRHPEWPYPDLILIDGGKGQLNAAKCGPPGGPQIPVIALAKKRNKLYIKGQKEPVLLKSLPQEFSNLILRARDEAHRFARKYHHKLREKSLLG